MLNTITAASILLAVVFLCSCGHSAEKIKEISDTDSSTSVEHAEDVTFSFTDSGKLQVVLKAPVTDRYHYDKNPYTDMKKGVDAKFYGVNGEVESTLKSNYAISYDHTKMVEVRSKVVVTNVKGEKLETEKLLWDQKKEQIYTDKYVTITTKNQIITGRGMRANQNFTKWTILKPQGTFKIDNDKQVDTNDTMAASGSN